MADQEVEQTLREIRERVRAEGPPATRADEPLVARAEGARVEHVEEARARLAANLVVLERAWDKLPPVASYRTGLAARVELWVKRLIKRATHWYTWEQVNFNAAALASLRDCLAALDACEQSLLSLKHSQAEAESRLEAKFDPRLAAAESGGAELRNTLAALAGELRGEVAALRDEQRERAAHLTEEHRVSFRQLSLEATEAAVALDRARRGLEARLDDLARRLEEMARTVNSES